MPIIVPQAGPPSSPVVVDQIAAVVNNEVITQSQLDQRVSRLLQRLAMRHVAPPPRALLARRVLSQMVLQRLQLQYAHNLGIKVGDDQLQRAEATLAERNHMTVSQFRQAVMAQGFTAKSFRERLRAELTIRELVSRRIGQEVTVSQRAVDRFLVAAKAAAGSQYRIAEITLPVPVAADQAQQQKVLHDAQRILAKIKAGEPFSQAAIAYSQDSHALVGGSLGWRTTAHLRPRFVRAVQSMAIGEVRLLTGHDAYYLIKLNGEKKGATGPAQPEVRLREIVLRPSKVMSDLAVHEKLKALKVQIAHGESFATAARGFSQGSAALKGGLLGWVRVATLPPALAQAAVNLPLHTVGGPYATVHGQALIEVLGRRSRSGMTPGEARQILRMRKGNALYVHWLQTLRDNAYVRYPDGV
ncbi:MAG TPA: peptidylprolyl isomerase [Acidiferrobacter sp.]|nr:peptidylprolyl isomerase [Acidiferrobacter sp.]